MSVSEVSPHYLGESGRQYANARLLASATVGYVENFSLFAPFLRPDHSVLEFGCGGGQMLPLLANAARSVAAVEVNETARAHAAQTGLRIFASLDDVPASDRFDVITSNHVLEHIADVASVLRRLRTLLKPRGQFITLLPYDDIRSARQRTWDRDDVDRHLHTWTPRLFANVLFESGFDVDSVRVVTSAWHPKLFGVRPVFLRKLSFRLLAILAHRRQIFAVARNPD